VGRNVFVVQAADSANDLTPLLAAQQWQLRRATHPDQISATLHGRRCHVGIVVFDDASAYSPGEFTDAIADSDSAMEWIAVVSPDAAREPTVAKLLSSSFFDYHTLPVDRSRLLYCVGHAYGKALLRSSLRAAAEPIESRYGMIGRSPKMLALYGNLAKVMRSRAPVLISGESGVGKELAAIAVHRGSTRHSGPFIPVNCGAIPETLVETQLFGHEKGAFTGAHEKHVGSIEAANGGTIFLDEIGDLPLSAQASLLRFLQESTIVRVGSTRPITIDARVIAATHVDLAARMEAGRFRADLFYRLNVLQVQVPALRERGTDVVLLAQDFFERNRSDKTPNVRGFADDALKAMQRYTWPGNVRELFNRLQRAMVMCDGPLITASDLQLDTNTRVISPVSLATARSGMERGIVQSALERNGNNVSATARALGISRVTLYRLLKRLDIGPNRDTSDPGAEGAVTERVAK